MSPASAFVTISVEGIVMQLVSLIVMYMVILQYALPYGQVVLTYAALSLLGAIVAKLVIPTLQISEQNRPMNARVVARQALSLVGAGFVDLVIGIAGFIALLVIASYRFSAVQILGMIAAGMAAGIVSNGVMAVV
jgi:hypothetical protein